MTLEELVDEIRDSLEIAKADASESHEEAMNSYGAGWDRGRCAGLSEAIGILLADPE